MLGKKDPFVQIEKLLKQNPENKHLKKLYDQARAADSWEKELNSYLSEKPTYHIIQAIVNNATEKVEATLCFPDGHKIIIRGRSLEEQMNTRRDAYDRAIQDDLIGR
jgi:hypothetical protein